MNEMDFCPKQSQLIILENRLRLKPKYLRKKSNVVYAIVPYFQMYIPYTKKIKSILMKLWLDFQTLYSVVVVRAYVRGLSDQ